MAVVVGGVPGDEAEEGVGSRRTYRRLKPAGGVEVGKFVVAGVADLPGAEVEVEGVGHEDGFGEGFVEADLLHVAGVFDTDVGDAEQPTRLGGVHGAVPHCNIGLESKQHPKQFEVEPQQAPYFPGRGLKGFAEGDVIQAIHLQQIKGALLLPARKQHGMAIFLQLLRQVAEDVHVGGMANVDEDFQESIYATDAGMLGCCGFAITHCLEGWTRISISSMGMAPSKH